MPRSIKSLLAKNLKSHEQDQLCRWKTPAFNEVLYGFKILLRDDYFGQLALTPFILEHNVTHTTNHI